MRQAGPDVETMDAAEVRSHWDTLLSRVAHREARVIVEQDGTAVAAVIALDDWKRLQRFDAERARDFAIVDEIGAAFADVPADELEREVAKAVAEARAELRAERERDAGRP